MINKIIKFICLTIVIIAVSFVFTDSAMADEDSLVVIFNPDPLFSEVNFLPGDNASSYAEVRNNSGTKQPISIEAINIVNDNVNGGGKFGDAFKLIITESTTERFNGTLTEFFDRGEFLLSNLADGASTTYNFFIDFDPISGNEYQTKNLKFDIIIAMQGDGSCNYNGEQDNGETGVDCGGGGCPSCGGSGNGGGGGGGGLPPGLTIKNENAVSTCTDNHTVDVGWLTSYNATSRVIYCEVSDTSCVFDLTDTNNDPNYPNLYGYTHTTQEDSSKVTGHNITILGLKENTEYKYRCISHASPDTIGYEKTFTTCECPVVVLGEEGLPNLKIDKTVNVNFANPGDTVKYEVNITNTGNITAFNTILIDILPDGFIFKDDKTSSKTWNLGNIENGQVKKVVYDVIIDNTVEEKVYTNLAQASADNHNQISDSADLEIRKIRVLGVELSPTGFSVKEFIILISLLIISLSSILILRKKIS